MLLLLSTLEDCFYRVLVFFVEKYNEPKEKVPQLIIF